MSKFEQGTLYKSSTLLQSIKLPINKMSSALSFTFRPSLIPAEYQAEYLSRFLQMVLDYETLTAPPSPSADSVPPPSLFAPMEGDGAEGEVPAAAAAAATKVRKNPWAGLTEEQRAEKIAAMKRGRAAKAERRVSADSLEVPAAAVVPVPAALAEAVPAATRTLEDMSGQELRDRVAELTGKSQGRTSSSGFPTKADLIVEIRRLEAVPAPVPEVAADTSSETSSKKSRKNPWANLSPEERAAKVATQVAAMRAGKQAKKAALLAAGTAAV
jgi:hypothetical protein